MRRIHVGAPSTARLVAEKALERTCGENCVEWAVAQLCAGKEGHHLAMLAGMVPPHNHFEIAALRDAAFRELGIESLSKRDAIRTFAEELLRDALADDALLRAAVREVAALVIADNFRHDLFDFYLLDCAFNDLATGTFTYHWREATRDNIARLTRTRTLALLEEGKPAFLGPA